MYILKYVFPFCFLNKIKVLLLRLRLNIVVLPDIFGFEIVVVEVFLLNMLLLLDILFCINIMHTFVMHILFI